MYEETEERLKFQDEYQKMQAKEREYYEHQQNCDYKYRKISRKPNVITYYNTKDEDINEDIKKIRNFNKIE